MACRYAVQRAEGTVVVAVKLAGSARTAVSRMGEVAARSGEEVGRQYQVLPTMPRARRKAPTAGGYKRRRWWGSQRRRAAQCTVITSWYVIEEGNQARTNE